MPLPPLAPPAAVLIDGSITVAVPRASRRNRQGYRVALLLVEEVAEAAEAAATAEEAAVVVGVSV
jgi:hypothetical protein